MQGAQCITPIALGARSSPARTEVKFVSSVLTFVSRSGSGPTYLKGHLFLCAVCYSCDYRYWSLGPA